MKQTTLNKGKINSIYTLRFYRDNEGTLCLDEIAKGGSLDDGGSMYLFGLNLAESKFLDRKDKDALAELCMAFIGKVRPEYRLVYEASDGFCGYRDCKGRKLFYGDRVLMKINREAGFRAFYIHDENKIAVFKEDTGNAIFVPSHYPTIRERIKQCVVIR